MPSPASIAKHPIHPMLVPIPIGLWIFSIVCDFAFSTGRVSSLWNDMAFYSLAGGIIGALLAVVPGLIDFLSISEPKTKRIGAIHLTLNLTVVGLYALNLWLRSQSPAGATVPIALSGVGIILLLVSGWLGGEMVYRRAVGVDIEGETAPTDVKTKRIA